MAAGEEEPPVLLDRSSRKTRGRRMTKLLDEEIEEDEQFWNQDALKEEDGDTSYDEEPEVADEFDSDFDEDEPEPDAEVENVAEDRLPLKKRLIFPGKTIEKKNKNKILSRLEEGSEIEKPSDTKDSSQPDCRDVPDDLECERIVRKSPRIAVIVRRAEREASRAAVQATLKTSFPSTMTSNVGSASTEQDPMSVDVTQTPRKQIIKFNRNGCPVGANATHFQRRVGGFVKTFVSIKYPDWRRVPKNYKDDVWNCILREFDVPSYVRKSVQRSMSDAFRKLKHSLRKKYLDKYANLEAQKLNIPPRIKKEEWEQFCINEDDEKHKQRRAQNTEIRKQNVFGHTGGRKSAAMIEEEMIEKQEDPTIPINRTVVWIATHTRKDGTPLPSAASFMEQVKAKVAEASQRESNNIHPLSIDDDPLSQVFGKESRGRVRGVGSCVSKRQYDASLPAHIMYSEERASKEVVEKKYERMEKKFERMETKLDLVVDFCTKYIGQGQAAGGTSTTMNPMMMNPTPTPTPTPTPGPSVGEVNSGTSARNEPTPTARLCELLDWEGNCVAIAKEVTDPMHRGNCHNHVLDPLLELKVSMVTGKMFCVKLYKAEKNPNAKTIGEVAVGDFLVWPKSHIRYTE